MALGDRFIAVNCWVKDILDGFLKKEMEDSPSKIVLKNNQEVSRVNLIGTITNMTKGVPFRFLLDDTTEQIEVIDFEKERDVFVGDFVRVVGIPKEYFGSKYLILEILKKTDPLWLKLKIKEIGFKEKDDSKRILEFIKEHDCGGGVSFEDLEDFFGSDCEKFLSFLLQKGFLFEIKPGFLKVIE
jgi:RPA family protein